LTAVSLMRPVPAGARFIVGVVLIVTAAGLAGLAWRDGLHAHAVLAVIDGVLCVITSVAAFRALRPIARTRFGVEEDVFEGSRGIVWSLAILFVIALVVLILLIVLDPDARRGALDGWREGGSN
jgi:hypothetical protein